MFWGFNIWSLFLVWPERRRWQWGWQLWCGGSCSSTTGRTGSSTSCRTTSLFPMYLARSPGPVMPSALEPGDQKLLNRNVNLKRAGESTVWWTWPGSPSAWSSFFLLESRKNQGWHCSRCLPLHSLTWIISIGYGWTQNSVYNVHILKWQDARFALDKDEQTTFIDSQGKLNPKAVKWSEVIIPEGRLSK